MACSFAPTSAATGTPLGDPTEAGSLAAVHRERTTPLVVGAAKARLPNVEVRVSNRNQNGN